MLISASACPLSHHQGIVKPPQSLEAPLPLCGYSQIYDLIKKGWFLVIPSFSRKFICLRFSKPDTAYKGHGGSNYRHCQTSSSSIHCIEEPPIVCQSSIVAFKLFTRILNVLYILVLSYSSSSCFNSSPHFLPCGAGV